ncbi:alpha/beta-hydrolase [Cucurbitaria berberidis CBS 394.84]|uniref:Alpha/beta-hydrolase n=1 Tax=Cucurbitaria berberidis CBS 394.84 TaxID=1168544 RepID=A0A9P4LEG6_9PLEO|nr:alpha/beta-hydrolase [Cucurbitaria berberidis CBS 394.84]KAF1852020.1 alpha/beta-hydrolase [Cucurbitaria berberidis CBS 394.84]
MAPTHSLLLSSLVTIPSLVALISAYPTKGHELDGFPPENSVASSISWSDCPPELGAPKALQCATFSVPIDWDKPYGEHFDLGLVKLPAAPSNNTSKIGSLFINPGGPGGRASELVAQVAMGALQAEEFLASFDIIGLDPRGVGLSKQMECDMSIYAERVSLYPQNEEEFEQLVSKNKRLGESCREKTGPLLEHMDTISAAKDHEAVRVALGNEPINFLGISYGTQLGAQYADLFPNNIRTLVLDGVVQHSDSEAANVLTEAYSYNLGLTHFFEWAGKNESSALKGQDVEALWTSLLTNASKTPIPAPSCNVTECRADVNAEEIRFNAQHFLAFAGRDTGLGSSWELLSSALYNATKGDASALSTSFSDPTAISFLGIGCLDWTHFTSLTLPSLLAKEAMATGYTPFTRGASQTWSLQNACLGWPIEVKNVPKKLNIKTKTTVLMVQSTFDPETGLPWALGMLEEIDNKVLLLREGDGHASFALGGEATKVVIEYFITGKAPKDGLVVSS